MPRLVLIDGNAVMHRAYHAIPETIKSPKGEPINAVYGLISIFLKILEDINPTHIAFAFDTPEPTFRKEILDTYQAHRSEMDKDLATQFEKAQEVIKAMGIKIFSKPGYEADDVIGTIVENSFAEFDEILIFTGDKDMLQLVSDNVFLYMPEKSLSKPQKYTKLETKEKLGVLPEQIVDYKALVGDPSDNYKGVPGIGPKTAVRLLHKMGSLENIYKNIEELGKREKELLIKHKDSAMQSKLLAKILRNLDLKFDFKECNDWDIYSSKAVSVYEKMGFNRLKNRIKIVSGKLKKSSQMSLI